jgi:hypothetical protein
MMKKIAILFAAALFGQVLLAGPVSPGRALEIGRTILDGPATRGNPSEAYILWDGEFSGSKPSEHPAFYVIGRDGGGFVIISGDDRARPVLGLSETNRFETENMPDNVRWWMESMKAYVRKQAVPGNPVRVQWDRLLQTRAGDAHITGTVTGKVEHLTPEWDQGNNDQWLFKQQVYNKYCPRSNGNLTITGCVATAVAEVLTTLSGLYPDDMPDRGTGTVGGYSVGSGYVAPQPYELTTVYDWAGLRTLKNAEAIRQALDNGQSEVVDNLGHLLADCGAILRAAYSVNATSAGSGPTIAARTAEHLYMSKTSHSESASAYSASKWVRMLKAEIDSRPVLYSGHSPENSGHSFVFDGYGSYQGETVFHVNFGWSGSANGYYFFDNLESGNGLYSDHSVTALFDYFPDARQQTAYKEGLQYYAFIASDGTPFNGITALGDMAPGQSRIRIGGIKNIGHEGFSGKIQFRLEDKFGNQKGDPLFTSSRESNALPSSYYTYWSGYTVRLDEFEFGDRIAGYYSTNGDGASWTRIGVPGDGNVVGELPLVPAAFICTEAPYYVGDNFEFRLMNYDQLYAGTVWTITAPDGTVSTVPQSDRDFELSQRGKYKIDAAIAPAAGEDVVEHVVTFITVR